MDVNSATRSRLELSFVVQDGDLEKLRKLLCDENVEVRDGAGCTPFTYAAACGQLEILLELYQRGANVNVQDYCGRTALMLAMDHGQYPIVVELCRLGADLELQDKHHQTALVRAARRDQYAMLKEICKHGAKVPLPLYTSSSEIKALLAKQQFRHNVLVLVDHIQIELLRHVHSWI